MDTLSPLWSTTAGALSYLFALAGTYRTFAQPIAEGGNGYVAVAVAGTMLFCFLMLISDHLFRFVLRMLDSTPARMAFVVACVLAFLAVHGVPGIVASVFGIVVTVRGYYACRKAADDAEALAQFETHGR